MLRFPPPSPAPSPAPTPSLTCWGSGEEAPEVDVRWDSRTQRRGASAAGSRSSPAGSARDSSLAPRRGPRPAARSPGQLGAVLAPGYLGFGLVGVYVSRELFPSSCNCGALGVTARRRWLRVCTPSFLGDTGPPGRPPVAPRSAGLSPQPWRPARPAFRAGAADLGAQPRAVRTG